MKTIGQFEIELQSNETQIRAVIRDVTKDEHTALVSPVFETRDSMRAALDSLMMSLSYVLRRRTWPDDTMICDAISDENGTRYINPRYPKPVAN